MGKYEWPCGAIRDLLPLYRDNICGEDSRRIVEGHIAECSECADILEQLNDNTVENALSMEADTVLKKHHSGERRAATTAGLVTAGILLIPVIVCLICNLVLGHGLSWFYIVLASLLVVGSVAVVPMLSKSCRFSKTIGSFLLSMFFLLLTCCIYTHGSWLWVAWVPTVFGVSMICAPLAIREMPLPDVFKNRKTLLVILWDMVWFFAMLGVCCAYSGGQWFVTAAAACTFGLSVVLMPVVIRQIRLPKAMQNHKGILVMIWDTVWLYILLFICARYADQTHILDYYHNAVWITAVCLLVPWAMFMVIRYVRANALTKSGVCVLIPTLFSFVADDIIARIIIPDGTRCDPSLIKNMYAVVSGQIPVDTSFVVITIVFSTLTLIGVLLIICGVAVEAGKKKNNTAQ